MKKHTSTRTPDIIPNHDQLVIGTSTNPVRKIVVDQIVLVDKMTNNVEYTTGPDGEKEGGVTIDSSNDLVINGNIATDTTFKQALTVTGQSNLNGAIKLNNNTDINTNYLSGDGTSGGLSFSGTSATFSNTLSITGELNTSVIRANGNIDLDSNWISGNGGTGGLKFTGTSATFSSGLTCGNLTATGTADIDGALTCDSNILATTGHVRGKYLQIADTAAVPATVAGYLSFYKAVDGLLKVRFGNGDIYRVDLTLDT
jgi:hypothetical protein